MVLDEKELAEYNHLVTLYSFEGLPSEYADTTKLKATLKRLNKDYDIFCKDVVNAMWDMDCYLWN